VFDVIFYNNKKTIQLTLKERREILKEIIEEVPWKIKLSTKQTCHTEEEIQEMYEKALDAGEEGVMIKSIESPYKPGSRVGHMVKLKPTMDTLDLTITSATWGEGKRAGWLTSFTVSCIQKDTDTLLTIGKVGTGFKEITENEESVSFENMTTLLKPFILSEKEKEVTLKPKIIIEIAFEEIQKSSTYTSGYALRFPRVIRLRSERNPRNGSTLADIKETFLSQKR